MIYLILTKIDGEPHAHSTWDNLKDATKQLQTLKDNGYRDITLIEINGTLEVNGEYYV